MPHRVQLRRDGEGDWTATEGRCGRTRVDCNAQ